MAATTQIANKLARLRSFLKVRPSVLIAGTLGGGTMIAFPAASVVIVVYVATVIAAIGVMAWIGMIAFVCLAAAALVVPIAILLAVLGGIKEVQWVVRITSSGRVAARVHETPAAG